MLLVSLWLYSSDLKYFLIFHMSMICETMWNWWSSRSTWVTEVCLCGNFGIHSLSHSSLCKKNNWEPPVKCVPWIQSTEPTIHVLKPSAKRNLCYFYDICLRLYNSDVKTHLCTQAYGFLSLWKKGVFHLSVQEIQETANFKI